MSFQTSVSVLNISPKGGIGPTTFSPPLRTKTCIYEFSTLAVSNRIQAELLRLTNLAEKDGKSARIAPAPTHTEVASRVSTHREAVTRELARLSRIGLIERQRDALLVKDVDRLAEMVHVATGG